MISATAIRRRWALRRCSGRALIDPSVGIERGATIEVGPAGTLEIGAGSGIGARARIVVGAGSLRIGSGVEVGERASIIALERIEIEDDVLLGAMSVVIDFLAPDQTVELPLRHQALASAPVRIGPGAAVGEKAVVGAGAVVAPRSRVVPGSTVGGVA